MAENIIQCWCHNTALFDPIRYLKWFRELSIVLHTCLHAIMKLPHYGYESGWTAKLRVHHDCVKSFGEVDKRHVKICFGISPEALKVMSIAFSESTFTFWDKPLLIKMNIQAIQQNFCQYLESSQQRIRGRCPCGLWMHP